MRWDRLLKRDQSRKTAKLLPERLGQKQLEAWLDHRVIDPYNAQAAFFIPVFVSYGVSRALLNPPLSRKGFAKSHTRFDDEMRDIEWDAKRDKLWNLSTLRMPKSDK